MRPWSELDRKACVIEVKQEEAKRI